MKMKISDLFLSICVSLVLLQLIVLCCLYDKLSCIYERKEFEFSETYHINRLSVDTIHCEEIEIFPLMDLDGNIVCE